MMMGTSDIKIEYPYNYWNSKNDLKTILLVISLTIKTVTI